MPRKPCKPNCTCGLHNRTKQHNALIGMSVSLTSQAKKERGIPHLTRERNAS